MSPDPLDVSLSLTHSANTVSSSGTLLGELSRERSKTWSLQSHTRMEARWSLPCDTCEGASKSLWKMTDMLTVVQRFGILAEFPLICVFHEVLEDALIHFS